MGLSAPTASLLSSLILGGGAAGASAFAPSPYQPRQPITDTSGAPLATDFLRQQENNLTSPAIEGLMGRLAAPPSLPDAVVPNAPPSFSGGGLPMTIGVSPTPSNLQTPPSLPDVMASLMGSTDGNGNTTFGGDGTGGQGTNAPPNAGGPDQGDPADTFVPGSIGDPGQGNGEANQPGDPLATGPTHKAESGTGAVRQAFTDGSATSPTSAAATAATAAAGNAAGTSDSGASDTKAHMAALSILRQIASGGGGGGSDNRMAA